MEGLETEDQGKPGRKWQIETVSWQTATVSWQTEVAKTPGVAPAQLVEGLEIPSQDVEGPVTEDQDVVTSGTLLGLRKLLQLAFGSHEFLNLNLQRARALSPGQIIGPHSPGGGVALGSSL